MKAGLVRALVLCVLVICGSVVSAATASPDSVVTVPSRADLFYAGLTAVPNPGLVKGGGLPTVYMLHARPGQAFTVTRAAGTLNWGPGSPQFSADGDVTGAVLGGVTNETGFHGISGIYVQKGQLFLAGVFLGSTPPSGFAPPRLRVASASSLQTLAPRLQQVFPIGGGRSSTGAVQRFKIPHGATRLYLGYVDGNGFKGNPGFYDDNTGSIKATLRVG